MKREIWIDFVKILAILLVVDLHVSYIGMNKETVNICSILYYLGTIAIPLFFMTNGYLQLRKKI